MMKNLFKQFGLGWIIIGIIITGFSMYSLFYKYAHPSGFIDYPENPGLDAKILVSERLPSIVVLPSVLFLIPFFLAYLGWFRLFLSLIIYDLVFLALPHTNMDILYSLFISPFPYSFIPLLQAAAIIIGIALEIMKARSSSIVIDSTILKKNKKIRLISTFILFIFLIIIVSSSIVIGKNLNEKYQSMGNQITKISEEKKLASDKEILKSILSGSDISLCHEASREVNFLCYFVSALTSKNDLFCDQIPANYKEDVALCHNFVQRLKNGELTKSACYDQTTPYEIISKAYECNFYLAVYFQEKSLCKKTKVELDSNICEKYIYT